MFSGLWPPFGDCYCMRIGRQGARPASASHWASTQPGGWERLRVTRGARRMVAEAEVQDCRSWCLLSGAGERAGAQPGHRAGTLHWWQGPGGGQCLRPRSPKAHPTANSWRAVSGAWAEALVLMARGFGCCRCEGLQCPLGPALSLRR